MSDESKHNRTFSKRMTVAAFIGIFAMAAAGMWSGYADTAPLVRELVLGSAAFLLIYMEIGHRDFRVSKGLPGFADILLGLLSRGGGGRRGGGE